MTQPALLFYCQHSVGLGHLMRSYALCDRLDRALPRRAAHRRRAPRGHPPARPACELVALPPLGVNARRRLRQRRPALHDRARVGRPRCSASCTTLRDVNAGGRAGRAVPVRAGEVRARARPAAGAGASDRRVHGLQPARHPRQHPREPARARRPRAQARRRAPRRGPRALRPALRPPGGDLQAERRPLSVPVHYTGFVAGATTHDHARTRRPHRRARAGGGRVGAPLLEAAIEACDGTPDARDRRPADAAGRTSTRCKRRAPGERRAPPLRPRPRARSSASAAASISQCGYNTALDLVRTRVPALVVPYATPEEDEQTRRARRLEQLGARPVADHIDGDLARLLDLPSPPPRHSTSTAPPPPATSSRADPEAAPTSSARTSSASGARCRRGRGHARPRPRRARQAVADRADRRPR